MCCCFHEKHWDRGFDKTYLLMEFATCNQYRAYYDGYWHKTTKNRPVFGSIFCCISGGPDGDSKPRSAKKTTPEEIQTETSRDSVATNILERKSVGKVEGKQVGMHDKYWHSHLSEKYAEPVQKQADQYWASKYSVP